jgi:zinc protease
MGYKVPVIGSGAEEWEPYALSVLSSILDGGDSARLTSEMVREQKLAASAGASYDAYSRLPSLFLMDGVPNEGVNLDQIEQALLEQVKRLHDAPISSDELKRVVTQAVAQKVFAADSFMSQAMELGSLDSIGLDWRLVNVEIENLKKVTPEQVQAVAKKYLVERNLTIARLDPEQTGAQQ